MSKEFYGMKVNDLTHNVKKRIQQQTDQVKVADFMTINKEKIRSCTALREGFKPIFNGTNEFVKDSVQQENVSKFAQTLENMKLHTLNDKNIFQYIGSTKEEREEKNEEYEKWNCCSFKELEKARKQIKLNSSPGINKQSNKYIKYGGEQGAIYCTVFFSILMALKVTPRCMRIALIKPLIN